MFHRLPFPPDSKTPARQRRETALRQAAHRVPPGSTLPAEATPRQTFPRRLPIPKAAPLSGPRPQRGSGNTVMRSTLSQGSRPPEAAPDGGRGGQFSLCCLLSQDLRARAVSEDVLMSASRRMAQREEVMKTGPGRPGDHVAWSRSLHLRELQGPSL